MTKFEQIQKEFKGVSGSIDISIDGIIFNFIDVDEDRFDGVKIVMASCGCCGEFEDTGSILSYELEYMDESDFQEVIEQLEKLKTCLAL
jgi:hypothetical protein